MFELLKRGSSLSSLDRKHRRKKAGRVVEGTDRTLSDTDLSLTDSTCDPTLAATSSSCRSLPLIREKKSSLRDLTSGHTHKPKSVSWSSIDVYSHAVVLGDHPEVSSGPPIAIGNQLVQKNTLSVEDYESFRPPRREKREMCLSRWDREDWLKTEGYGRADFRHATEQAQKIKKLRAASSKPSLWGLLVDCKSPKQQQQKLNPQADL